MTDYTQQVASLEAAYAACRDLHRTHGRSYYLATRLLPPWKRRHVHALYGFTRYSDDIVDGGDEAAGQQAPERARLLGRWASQFYAAIEGERPPADLILRAVRHTVATFGLPRADFDAFFASMRMDLHVREYADYGALLEYMEGSAAVIGTMMLPILFAPEDGPGPLPAAAVTTAREPARQLGPVLDITGADNARIGEPDDFRSERHLAQEDELGFESLREPAEGIDHDIWPLLAVEAPHIDQQRLFISEPEPGA